MLLLSLLITVPAWRKEIETAIDKVGDRSEAIVHKLIHFINCVDCNVSNTLHGVHCNITNTLCSIEGSVSSVHCKPSGSVESVHNGITNFSCCFHRHVSDLIGHNSHGTVEHADDVIAASVVAGVGGCTEARVVIGASGATGAGGTGAANLVNWTTQNIPSLPIVACIQPCIEPSFPVLDHPTPHPGGLGPHHLAVVPCLVGEAVPGHAAHRKDVDFIEPRIYCLSPIFSSFSRVEGLIKILSYFEPTNSSTIWTVVVELALVCMSLGHAG